MKKKSARLKKFNLRRFKFKGFTLIELLSVIVILAIIALIATPIVLNSIENAQEGAAERTTENYIDAVETKVASTLINGKKLEGTYTIQTDGNLCLSGQTCDDNTEIKIDMGGKKPSSGTIVIENGQVTNASTIKVGDYTVSYDSDKESFVATKDGESNEPLTDFSKDSWATIQENVKTGNISSYKVGDTKKVTLTGEVAGTYTLRIANTSTPSECSTDGFSQTACGFVIEFVDIITERSFNFSGTNKGGWRDSEIRAYVNSEILDSLPTDLQSTIIDTTAVSGYGYKDTENFSTEDKLYLLTSKEVYGNGSADRVVKGDTSLAMTRQLDYYKSNDYYTNNKSTLKQYDGEDADWWLRSANDTYAGNVFYVHTLGYWDIYSAQNKIGVSPAFRIG